MRLHQFHHFFILHFLLFLHLMSRRNTLSEPLFDTMTLIIFQEYALLLLLYSLQN